MVNRASTLWIATNSALPWLYGTMINEERWNQKREIFVGHYRNVPGHLTSATLQFYTGTCCHDSVKSFGMKTILQRSYDGNRKCSTRTRTLPYRSWDKVYHSSRYKYGWIAQICNSDISRNSLISSFEVTRRYMMTAIRLLKRSLAEGKNYSE